MVDDSNWNWNNSIDLNSSIELIEFEPQVRFDEFFSK